MNLSKQWLWVLGAVAVAAVIAIFALVSSGSESTSPAPPAPETTAVNPQEPATVEQPKPEAIVKNGGFDQDGNWLNLKMKVQQEKDGNFFASNRFNWSFYQEVKLDPDAGYTLNARVRKGLSSARARLCVQFYDSQGAKIGEGINYYHTFQGKEWETIPAQNFRTPTGTASAKVFLMTEDSATHDFDDIQIVPGAQGSSAPVPQTKPDTPKPQSAAPQPAPAASKQQESKAPVPQSVNYIVYSGDTLGQIAKQHTTTVEALVNANKITDSNKIYVKQKLVIPPGNK